MTWDEARLHRTDVIVFVDGVSVDDVIAGLREVNERLNSQDKTGYAWEFPLRQVTDIFDQVDTLSVGIRGQAGTLLWHDETGGYVPTGGENVRGVDYYMGGHHHGGFQNADGIDLPIDRVFEALREYARTGTRPTCVKWANTDDVQFHEPHMDTGEVIALPSMSLDDVLAKVTAQDRPRSWRLFLAEDETDVRLSMDKPPMLWFGLDTDERGFLFWEDSTGMYMPAHGGDESSHGYFALGDSTTGVPARSVIPSAEVQQAIREAVTTRQRPTCIEWVPRPRH